jgi:hypothetical protein
MVPQTNPLLLKRQSIEPLEQRIAPAVLTGFRGAPTQGVVNLDADPNTPAEPGLTTDLSGGRYLLYVTKGSCKVFLSDLNGNGKFDYNEITGISAGDGLRLICFTDIHGDIVTNLKPDFTLTDSDNDSSNGFDGRVVLKSTIERIEMRSVTQEELPEGIPVESRVALSNYSIFGTIYAGGGFGAADGGLSIDVSGREFMAQFDGFETRDRYQEIAPVIGGIKVGSAVSNQHFSFGTRTGPRDRDGIPGNEEGLGHGFNGTNITGRLIALQPLNGEAGADINGFKVVDDLIKVELGTLAAGDAGSGGRGGDVKNIRLPGDIGGGYRLLAGNAGAGFVGARGGNIENFMDLGSSTGEVVLRAGNGGNSTLGAGGNGGGITISNDGDLSIYARLRIEGGNGGNGLTDGGSGGGIAALRLTVTNTEGNNVPVGVGLVSTMHLAPTVRTLTTTGTATVVLDPDSPVTTGGLYVGQSVAVTLADGTVGAPRRIVAVDYFGKSVTLDAPVSAIPALGGTVAVPQQVTLLFGGDIGVALQDRPGAAVEQKGLIRGFDFDADGLNDVVYATNTAQNGQNQLNVLFGGSLNDAARTIYLNCATSPGAITVNDFNGDGRPDIAAASTEFNVDGIRIYLSEFDPVTGAFTGFSDAIFNQTPGFYEYGSNPANLRGRDANNGARVILKLESGDFDGDGNVDIAFSTREIGRLGELRYFVSVLRNEEGGGRLVWDLDFDADPVINFDNDARLNGGGEEPILRATVDRDGVGDVLLIAARDQRVLVEARVNDVGDFVERRVLTGARKADLTLDLDGTIGVVDTNRLLTAGTTVNVSLQAATISDFVIRDLDSDGLGDLVFLTKAPDGYLITFKGEAAGIFTIASDNLAPAAEPVTNATQGDQAGIYIADAGNVGIFPSIDPRAGATFGNTNAVTVIRYEGELVRFATFVIDSGDLYDTGGNNQSLAPASGDCDLDYPSTTDATIRQFDAYSPVPGTNSDVTSAGQGFRFLFQVPIRDDYRTDMISSGSPFADFAGRDPLVANFANNGVFVVGGDGGNGRLGNGGAGGTVGGGTLRLQSDGDTTRGIGSADVLLPSAISYEGDLRFIGGAGGQGGTNGGAGGSVSGISNDYAPGATFRTSTAQLLAGAGGLGRSGTGGKGGDISQFCMFSANTFLGGAGGDGLLSGGAGGSVIGSGDATLPSSKDIQFFAVGGEGGRGVINGGAGGAVRDLQIQVNLELSFGSDFNGLQVLQCLGGIGGAGASGKGGAGGDIKNIVINRASDPFRGDLILQAGDGGRGSTLGGAGGSVVGFNNEAQGSTAQALSMIAGNGGRATKGSGGAGGGVSGIVATASGEGSFWNLDLTDPSGVPVPTTTALQVGRVVAGQGGDSVGSVGGAGGSLLNFAVTTTTRSLVVAAGRGGDGLKAGGNGGGVTNSSLDAGSFEGSKLLIVAGEGGNALGALPRVADPLAFGGRDAKGGDGGSISSVRQEPSETVVDLIAGNGGDTLNYGSILDLVSNVGKGGSIRDVNLTGDAGRIDGGPLALVSHAIKSYNNIYNNQRMTEWVRDVVVGGGGALDDSDGNVGIVVGAKGRVRDVAGDESFTPDGIPDRTSAGLNGSLVNFAAAQIMSAVAGSVDSVAAIQSIINVRLTRVGGVFGEDKATDSLDRTSSGDGRAYRFGDSQLDYLDYDDPLRDNPVTPGGAIQEDRHSVNVTNGNSPVIGGKLVDGAIIGANQRTKRGPRDFILNG